MIAFVEIFDMLYGKPIFYDIWQSLFSMIYDKPQVYKLAISLPSCWEPFTLVHSIIQKDCRSNVVHI